MNERKITEKQFRAYERVRVGGETNMIDWMRVQSIAFHKYNVFLDRKDIFEIIENYNDYSGKFGHTDLIPA